MCLEVCGPVVARLAEQQRDHHPPHNDGGIVLNTRPPRSHGACRRSGPAAQRLNGIPRSRNGRARSGKPPPDPPPRHHAPSLRRGPEHPHDNNLRQYLHFFFFGTSKAHFSVGKTGNMLCVLYSSELCLSAAAATLLRRRVVTAPCVAAGRRSRLTTGYAHPTEACGCATISGIPLSQRGVKAV